jgi:hypothetical protein
VPNYEDLKIDFLIPASPIEGFFSQIAMFRFALDALGPPYRNARLVAVFGAREIVPIPPRWAPYFARIDVEWADCADYVEGRYDAQSDRRFEVFRSDADLVISCDADTMLIRPLEPWVLDSALAGGVGGVLAFYPFPWRGAPGATTEDWQAISKAVLGREIEMNYRYSLQDAPCPFYINLGFLIGSAKSIGELYAGFRQLRDKVRAVVETYFAEQILFALTVSELGLKAVSLPLRYNFPNDSVADQQYPEEIPQARVIHFLRGTYFNRRWVFARQDLFERFLSRTVEGSNLELQTHLRRITGGVYPFKEPAVD